MQKQKLFFGLVCMIGVFLFSQCKKETENTGPLPPVGDVETWVSMANEDIVALGSIVKAIEQEDLIERVETDEELIHLHFASGASAKVRLDYANYPAPLVGAHLIDDKYYWTIINGTGTSSVRLIKDKDRKNYPISSGHTPSFVVNGAGNWTVSMEGIQEEIFDAEGKPFRAIGRRSLFSNIVFDIDSNATVTTNEAAEKSYLIRRNRPFTFLFERPEDQVLTIASGFAIAVDFRQVGVEELEFDLPAAWSATYTLNPTQKSGVLEVTSPTGMEADFAEEGVITIRAKDQYGRQLVRQIPVKVEVGVVNYASVTFTDIVAGVELTGATFTFAENLTSTSVRDVTAIKAGDAFRLMMPDGFPDLRKVTFTTASGSFDYYFKPDTWLTIGEQSLSIAPPKRGDYWKGGMIVHIDQTLPLSGIAAYQITGKVVHVWTTEPNTDPNDATGRRWFPNGSNNVTGANSDTNGATNTTAIINALGGPGATDGFIARWAIRVRAGGYGDWYLGAVQDYQYFHDVWAPTPWNPTPNNSNPPTDPTYIAAKNAINQKIESYGGNLRVRDQHRLFWTSTNFSATHAKAYDVRLNSYMTTGEKIYRAYGMAFRDF